MTRIKHGYEKKKKKRKLHMHASLRVHKSYGMMFRSLPHVIGTASQNWLLADRWKTSKRWCPCRTPEISAILKQCRYPKDFPSLDYWHTDYWSVVIPIVKSRIIYFLDWLLEMAPPRVLTLSNAHPKSACLFFTCPVDLGHNQFSRLSNCSGLRKMKFCN